MKTTTHPTREELSLTRVLAALADTVRIGVVRQLADGRELGWSQLQTPVAKSTLSHHMKVLRDAGITRTRSEGTRCYVTLRADDLETRFPGLLSTVLRSAESEDVGSQVTVT